MKNTIALILLIVGTSAFGQLTTSNLPIIKITVGGAIPDEPKVMADMGIINNGTTNNINDPFTDYDGKIGIETRGNSTQDFDKKTYSIELWTDVGADTSVALLGMPKEEDWILHAMVIDKSLLRIPMSFYFSQRMGHYASRWRFVEVVINGDYRGVYILTEKIKRDKNRVDIAKLKDTDIADPDVTGGYILRIDWLENPSGFASNYLSLGGIPMFYQWYYPKASQIQPAQINYISAYMNEFEEALQNPNGQNTLGKHYSEYIDLTSFADFVIMNELSRNSDGYKLSSYVHKHKVTDGNKFHAGPIWDFDQTYGVSEVCVGADTDGWNYLQPNGCEDFESMPFWWAALMDDPIFQNHIKCRWESHRSSFLHKDSINQWIDQQAAYIDQAKDRNFTKWPVLGTVIWAEPDPVPADYAGEITYMKDWISDRIDWLDANMPGDCSQDQASIEEESQLQIDAYPNPSTGTFNIVLPEYDSNGQYMISSSSGKIIETGSVSDSFMLIDLHGQPKGMYILKVIVGEKIYYEQLVRN